MLIGGDSAAAFAFMAVRPAGGALDSPVVDIGLGVSADAAWAFIAAFAVGGDLVGGDFPRLFAG
jgi:hypothetical protein